MPDQRTRTERLRDRFFDSDDHPYHHLERAIQAHLRPDSVLLEAGCGRRAEVLRTFRGRAGRLIGVDLVEYEEDPELEELELVQGDIADTSLPSESVDLVISRALMEHLPDPRAAFAEIHRVLKPGGRYVYLVPNLGDYGSIVAKLTPNRLHPRIVKLVEGRAPKDTFPAFFRCNTRAAIKKWCDSTGLVLEDCRYLGQYPAYFMFNPVLFTLAAGYEKVISKFEALRFLRGWLLVEIGKPGEAIS